MVLAMTSKLTLTGSTQNGLVYQSSLQAPLSRQAATAKSSLVQEMSMTLTATGNTVCT